MGKKESKKDKEATAARKAAKSAKQASKAASSAKKTARKVGALDSDEEDIEVILKQLAAADAKRTSVVVEPCARPSPRVNFSLTPLGGAGGAGGELLVFGGEYFDGAANTCFNDL
jgi:hypothetical protein